MKNIALEVDNLSKQYRLGQVGTGTISHDLNRWWHKVRGKEDPYLKIGESNDRTKSGDSDYVWALRDINFQIEQGDAVGIIGRNGAGKSTLLKLLSKVTKPTLGEIKVKGRIASLLEVGTGFHPEMTGRENIYLNGAILGMTRREIRRKFDEIVDFAGVERYIDTPVKRYSSGMYVRLAFAVAAHLESEILIVDEVLAVGDAEFQKKCLGKMGDVSKGEGRTVLFVSHNIAAVRELCQKGIYLENGNIQCKGDVNECLNYYLGKSNQATLWEGHLKNDEIDVKKTAVYSGNEYSIERIKTSNDITIEIHMELKGQFDEVGIGFYIKSQFEDNLIRCFYNDYQQIKTLPKGEYIILFKIPPFYLSEGRYKIVFDISRPSLREYTNNSCDLIFDVEATTVIGNRYFASSVPTFGSIIRPHWLYNIINVK
ncbi:ABC transporter ATP-binding protein [Sphingobacterium multivorum]|uniref:ABC transporter ATP-binding protein n=1 Tax=Sphingobacterium multivorum TaxID=28454 RepID=UPI00289A8C2D|nr:polysaccharide ABC transporter ATP-binding protein [Sphingobacterium multivorum]